ncbi:hypothetical protein TraAM80_08687 [Trypanosoma rangeli]|uniref:Small acidic protein n=1 Tax=Trypanosoma rangeli TaxID=5698 RepID=A0A422MZK0_TRYRA|nr:uncharacterized protein TraAM80_08687 [Trypanosoma rangeli]RNE98617.1 hypothetical protein TraAM80_08687 [Trypanosoma rangeli]|eukprot:RNE98617.1 hypothetical protein TraAM80_08687 [Trypanosoma rangeli]
MTPFKSAAQELQVAALALAESRGLQLDALPCRSDALLLLAAAALKCVEAEATSSSPDVFAAAREARRLLRPHLPRLQQPAVVEATGERAGSKRGRVTAAPGDTEAGGGDLGQYSNTHAFDGDTKRRAKFTRLMGGRRGEESHHNTFAADDSTLKRINDDLEEQFNTALSRHGKKGLGA